MRQVTIENTIKDSALKHTSCFNEGQGKIVLWNTTNPWYQYKLVNLLQNYLVNEVKAQQDVDMITFTMETPGENLSSVIFINKLNMV